ncbi:MAG: hypothetical protein LH702_11710 [Phormidesmis sp. CAN_BIN44]|nr:hypothetical protein [Phormidesmis sp. CAN_BIN44]
MAEETSLLNVKSLHLASDLIDLTKGMRRIVQLPDTVETFHRNVSSQRRHD